MIELIEQYVGRTGVIKLDGLEIEVKIGDVKQSWGKTRYLVSPVAGEGEKWVENIAYMKGAKV